MVTRGRPPLGCGIVDLLDGTDEQKLRLRTIMEVIAGKRSVEEACELLGIERARYYMIQHAVLVAGLEALLPRKPGRPQAAPPPEDTRVRELEEKVSDLELEVELARVREEIALTMPHVTVRANHPKRPRRKLR